MKVEAENARKKPKVKIIIIIVLTILVGLTTIYFKDEIINFSKSIFGKKDSTKETELTDETEAVETDSNTVHFAALGDMIAHDTINFNAKTESGYDYVKFFQNIRPAYDDADIIFCNQEGLSSGLDFGISGYPTFNAPTEFASGLSSGGGCNLINLANNHIGDKGTGAIARTLDVWSELPKYAVAGANKTENDQKQVKYFTIKDIKFSFLAFADFNNNSYLPGYAVNIYHNEELFDSLLAEARQNSDFVIVSMHWGTEDSQDLNNDQKSTVNKLANLGVDLVIGTGPHVLQKAEMINRVDGGNMLVWYSLGNMLSSQLNINQLTGGIAELDIEKTSDNKILVTNIQFTPTYMHYEWTNEEKNNYDLLARKNAMIYLMNDASGPLSRSLFNTNIAERLQYVRQTIGDEVAIQ